MHAGSDQVGLNLFPQVVWALKRKPLCFVPAVLAALIMKGAFFDQPPNPINATVFFCRYVLLMRGKRIEIDKRHRTAHRTGLSMQG